MRRLDGVDDALRSRSPTGRVMSHAKRSLHHLPDGDPELRCLELVEGSHQLGMLTGSLGLSDILGDSPTVKSRNGRVTAFRLLPPHSVVSAAGRITMLNQRGDVFAEQGDIVTLTGGIAPRSHEPGPPVFVAWRICMSDDDSGTS